jgi:hypothetical protein
MSSTKTEFSQDFLQGLRDNAAADLLANAITQAHGHANGAAGFKADVVTKFALAYTEYLQHIGVKEQGGMSLIMENEAGNITAADRVK